MPSSLVPTKIYSRLPDRRLKEYANGIWDEDRQAFYPYTVQAGALSGKSGISYYVKSVNVTAIVEGILARSAISVGMSVLGVSKTVFAMFLPATTQVTDYNSIANVYNIGILGDTNTGITVSSSVTYGLVYSIYAEIPSDTGVDISVS